MVYYSGAPGDDRGADRGRGVPPSRGVTRAKKAAVAIVGLSAVGAGAYFGTTLLTGASTSATVDTPRALAPITPTESPSPSPTDQDAPSPGPLPGTRSGQRQRRTASPSPSIPISPISPITDTDIAAEQVSRLVQAPPPVSAEQVGVTAQSPVTVTTETGTDGSLIRVMSAHYDLTGKWAFLLTGDKGRVVGGGRCTHNVRTGPGQAPQQRPGLLLCWRTTDDKGVVTVAVGGRPQIPPSLAALDRQWDALG